MIIPMFIIALKINDVITLDWNYVFIPLILQIVGLIGLMIIGKTNK